VWGYSSCGMSLYDAAISTPVLPACGARHLENAGAAGLIDTERRIAKLLGDTSGVRADE